MGDLLKMRVFFWSLNGYNDSSCITMYNTPRTTHCTPESIVIQGYTTHYTPDYTLYWRLVQKNALMFDFSCKAL